MSNINVIKSNEEGRCPVCNSMNVTYYGNDIDGNILYYECECDDCNSTWHECYDISFMSVDDVRDKEGKEVYNTYSSIESEV